jgi:sulfur dioxygenase
LCDLGLTLKYCINTHLHSDHISGSGRLKMKFPGCQSVLSNVSSAQADIHLPEYDCIAFGSWRLYALFTPGHTGVSLTLFLVCSFSFLLFCLSVSVSLFLWFASRDVPHTY